MEWKSSLSAAGNVGNIATDARRAQNRRAVKQNGLRRHRRIWLSLLIGRWRRCILLRLGLLCALILRVLWVVRLLRLLLLIIVRLLRLGLRWPWLLCALVLWVVGLGRRILLRLLRAGLIYSRPDVGFEF